MQLKNWRHWCLWLQKHVQEFNGGPQSQMQQHWKSMHREHPTKVQTKIEATLW